MTATEQLISNFVAEEWLTHHLVGVADHDGLALVDDSSVDEPGVVVCPFATPATGLDLHLVALVSELEHSLRSFEQEPSEVRDESEGIDVDIEFIHHPSELIALVRCVELSFVTDDELQWHSRLDQLEEIEVR